MLSDLEEMTGYTHRGVPVSVHFRDVYRDMAKDGLHTVIQVIIPASGRIQFNKIHDASGVIMFHDP